jgi:hypothetical protein
VRSALYVNIEGDGSRFGASCVRYELYTPEHVLYFIIHRMYILFINDNIMFQNYEEIFLVFNGYLLLTRHFIGSQRIKYLHSNDHLFFQDIVDSIVTRLFRSSVHRS